jgi:cold shock CspA family protein/ribosome-associated translation inhibitor RaiA
MLPLDVHIAARNLEILPEWREKIIKELSRLQKHTYETILHARAELTGTKHHRHGNFAIQLVISLPGATLTVNRKGESVLPLIVEAFDVLDRRLREHSRVKQQQVKVHLEQSYQGRIARLFPAEGYGFIAAPDGGEVYFHKNALRQDVFEKLSEGMSVKFDQELGDKGPQATWVDVTE